MISLSRRRFLGCSFALASAAAVAPAFRLAYAADGFFEVTAGPSSQPLYRADMPASDLWTYNGTTPGPEIRVPKGDRVRVRLINRLEEPTSIHWHGVRIANAMDGVSGLTQRAVEPGETFEYDFVAPDAGTYWYHAHNRSWNQVARGLYGPLIVDEDEPPFDREHDLTLVIDDWRLDRNGVLDTASFGSLMDWSHGGRLGNWLTVNGQGLPRFDLNAGEAYRLRLINAANARILEIDPARFSAKILAYDGQALPELIKLDYAPLLVGPAQRVDLLVVPIRDFALEEVSGDQPFAFASFAVRGHKAAETPALAQYPNVIPEPDLANARTIALDMRGGAMSGPLDIIFEGRKLTGQEFQETRQLWSFNGVANLAQEPLFRAKHGETIIIKTVNNTVFAHAMHVHGHHFRVIERSGSQIDEGRPWRDTFLVGPDQTTKIAFVADNPGRWLLHCHMLEHAAAGMNTWFEVV
jgi:FtsP/CotA-like multicopper oxidase with cupredoxin domain